VNYYPHHIGDYAKDTAHLSMIEDGAYRRLIDLYYSTEAPLTSDMTKLYRLVRAFTKQDRKAVSDMLNEFFTLTDAGYTQRRCDAEILRMQAKSDKARASVEKRWTNERNTRTDTNVSTNEHTNVLPTQYEGNTPNSQEPITNNQEPKKVKNKAQAPFSLPDWIPQQAWEGWVMMRAKKRTPNTEHALNLAVRELEKLRALGDDPEEILNRSTQRGWTGLFPINGHTHAKTTVSSIPPERL
jgi:uncharacterized protein YdaU (DUF1376 family)